jgi:hypothetical protein
MRPGAGDDQDNAHESQDNFNCTAPPLCPALELQDSWRLEAEGELGKVGLDVPRKSYHLFRGATLVLANNHYFVPNQANAFDCASAPGGGWTLSGRVRWHIR